MVIDGDRVIVRQAFTGDPRDMVLLLAKVTREMCISVDRDRADGIMLLLAAAALIAREKSEPGLEFATVMGESLGDAMTAVEEWFYNPQSSTEYTGTIQ